MKGINENSKLGIGLMARAPVVGRVKTRLAADIGAEKATAVYRDLLSNISGKIISDTQQLCGKSVNFCWFADPQEAIPTLREQYGGFAEFFPQSAGDLGERMKRALEVLLQRYDFAALIGADIPDISASHIGATLTALKENDVVLGPTFDGGYYLIGVRQVYGELFDDIPWSAANTLAETIAACKSANLRYHLLPTLSDLDVVEDFSRIKWRPSSVSLETDKSD